MGRKILISLILISCLYTFSRVHGETLSVSSSINLHFENGNQYLDKGNYELAIQEYQTVIQLDSKYRPVWRKLGDAYRFQNNYDSAMDSYLKFVGLSEDKNDEEGKKLLLEVAKAWEQNVNNSIAALRAVDGLLTYYYAESNNRVEDVIKNYHDSYVMTAQTTRFYYFPRPESVWTEAMYLRGKILRKLNRTKEAYENFSQYFALLRYKYKETLKYSAYSPLLTGGWADLYYEIMDKPISEEWQSYPWIITLSPETSEYLSAPKDTRHWEDSIQFNRGGDNYPSIWHYIIQAKPGYRFSKLILSADMTPAQNKEVHYWAYNFEKMIPHHEGILGIPFQSYQGKTWSETTIIQQKGIRVFVFNFYGLKCNPYDYSWKVKAEFLPESYYASHDTAISKTRPTLRVYVEPPGLSKSIIDDGIEEFKDHGEVTDYPFTTGWHTIVSEKPGFPKKETKFYWDSTTNVVLHVNFGSDWNQMTSNLVYPANLKSVRILWDRTGTYRLVVVASPNGQDDLYTSSSKNLSQWTPLEKLDINDWTDDNQPCLFQNNNVGKFILIWKSKRRAEPPPVGYDDLWESTSYDFIHWTRPVKILTVPDLRGLDGPMEPYVYQESSGQYHLFVASIHSQSDDGMIWSKPKTLQFEYPPQIMNANYFYYHSSNGKLLGFYHEGADRIRLFDSKDKKNFKTYSLLTELTVHPELKQKHLFLSQGCQFIELGLNDYGFLFHDWRDWYLSRSDDWIHWTPAEKVLSSLEQQPFSNFIKSADTIITIQGNEIWYTKRLLVIPPSENPNAGGFSYRHHGN